jgi:hypothetical protein
MTKREQQIIASALREERETALALFEPHHADGIAVAAKRIAHDLGNESNRFDVLTFLRAVGLSDDEIASQS